MRYNDRITFMLESKGSYNTKTSKYEPKTTTYDEEVCNINPLSMERLAVEFGDITKDIMVARLQGNYDNTVSHALVNDIKYKVVTQKHYIHDTVFYLESVN